MEITLKPDQIKGVKGQGFLHNKGTNQFSGRVITVNGHITADQAIAIANAAKKYGDGNVCYTTRLTVECPGIDFENIPAFTKEIQECGLDVGGTGAKVRPVVSCKGTTCQYGLLDAFGLAEKIHNRFYVGYRSVALPHKMKIAVGGCPNNCVKPDLNDIGIVGQMVPGYNPDECKGCKKCQMELACPIGAAKLVDGKLNIDPDKCNHCGRCLGKCPFKCAQTGTPGYAVYLGGRWGKSVAMGKLIDHVFTSEEDVLDFVEKAILFYRHAGIQGERFANTIERLGFDYVTKILLTNEMLDKKEEILGK